ncbi:hypothetical protein BN1221_01227 [Brenneria goodwinii]|uniref:Uncharacterized protein n=1 Tax=Brenneria goodwinii TaxID=1109412 RepID=A0A0G4JSY0_9GAMM|nr:hypothetical protein BN1221_01227 [Brenneria goodwinii]
MPIGPTNVERVKQHHGGATGAALTRPFTGKPPPNDYIQF